MQQIKKIIYIYWKKRTKTHFLENIIVQLCVIMNHLLKTLTKNKGKNPY